MLSDTAPRGLTPSGPAADQARWEARLDLDAEPGNVLPVVAALLLELAKADDRQTMPAGQDAGRGKGGAT
jgi:hypothetical protein